MTKNNSTKKEISTISELNENLLKDIEQNSPMKEFSEKMNSFVKSMEKPLLTEKLKNNINSIAELVEKPLITNVLKTSFDLIPTVSLTDSVHNTLKQVSKIMSNNFEYQNELINKLIINITLPLTDYMYSMNKGLELHIKKIGQLSELNLLAINQLQNKIIQSVFTSDLNQLNITDIMFLDKNFWVIPSGFSLFKIKNVNNLDKDNFENEILKNSSEKGILNLFDKVAKHSSMKKNRVIINQCKQAYKNGHYALVINSLISIFDGLAFPYIKLIPVINHKSTKIFEKYFNALNNDNAEQIDYKDYHKLWVLVNFIRKLYKDTNFSNYDNKELSRHVNSHGIEFSNKKIDAIRMLHAIDFMQQVLPIIDKEKIIDEFNC